MTASSASARRLPAASALFDACEPVLQSHPLVEGVPVPRFGDRVWDFGLHDRPANKCDGDWTVKFVEDPVWSLRTREVLMIMLNPGHPAVRAAGHRRPTRQPCTIVYAVKLSAMMRLFAAWAIEAGLPSDLRLWDADAPRLYVEKRRTQVKTSSLVSDVEVIRKLHLCDPYLTGGGLAVDPWKGQSARSVANVGPDPVTTPNIAPDTWFALMRAAYTYVHEFAPDILAARVRYRALIEAAEPTEARLEQQIVRFAADPASLVPVHVVDRAGRYHARKGAANFQMLYLTVGFDPEKVKAGQDLARYMHIRRLIEPLVAAGRVTPAVLVTGLRERARPDGSRGPWHAGLGPLELSTELIALRNAIYVLVAGLSMMRDSEIRQIRRGSVVEYCGSPALLSRKRKRDPGRPWEHWWICDQVAEAIAVAEDLSWHDELIFTGSGGSGFLGPLNNQISGFASHGAVYDFIRHVNQHTFYTGLAIPPGRAAPQQFRKTMAMLTAHRPGGEIATRHQLKHVAVRVMANRVAQGYWADDQAWAKLFDTALKDVRIERLADLYGEYRAAGTLGSGSAAERLAVAFDAVAQEAEQLRASGKARHGDARVEFDLLRHAGISIRFGTLNHCTVDDRNPVGAKCLESGLALPPGHTGPVQNLCQPGKCANALIRPEHLAIRRLERVKLTELMANPRLSPPQREALQLQLDEVDEVIAKVQG